MGNDRGKPVHHLDLNLLELFECIWQTRNLTAAGERLGLSQPAVSRGLGRLRDTYSDELFVRHRRGVEPTVFAKTLIEPISTALEIVRRTIEKPDFAPTKDTRRFRVALSDVGERYFLPRLAAWLAGNAPHVSIDTVSVSREELLTGLDTGKIDLAVGFLPGLGKQVYEKRLFVEKYVYIARVGHPSVAGSLRASQLRELPHVVGSPQGTLHAAAVEKVLTGPKLRAVVAMRVGSFLSIGPIVADSDLVAVVPSNFAVLVSEHVALQLITPPVQFPSFGISMVWHRRFHSDPAGIWLREVYLQLFGK
ncbi:LysR family transcriptional regulator [Burkholderia diffusa]|uniref:LysR family transcriptional regulator n=1 Tax=Burkholderia diffusa TaxID=488732 RepID=UPI001E408F7D|nr:LysR family transcriptional regulator [Burkholderia diffusa]